MRREHAAGEAKQEGLEDEDDSDHDVSVYRSDLNRATLPYAQPWLERSPGATKRRSGDDPILRGRRPGLVTDCASTSGRRAEVKGLTHYAWIRPRRIA
jgi:hypothetical protein